VHEETCAGVIVPSEQRSEEDIDKDLKRDNSSVMLPSGYERRVEGELYYPAIIHTIFYFLCSFVTSFPLSVPNETLFVVNFNEETNSREDLQMLFEPYGELHRIDMKRNYAFVQFKTVDAAARAKDATNGGKLDQNEITVEFVRRVRRQLSARRAEEIRRRGSHLNSQCAPDVSDISIDDMDDEVLKLHQRRCMYFTRKRQRDFEQALLNGK